MRISQVSYKFITLPAFFLLICKQHLEHFIVDSLVNLKKFIV